MDQKTSLYDRQRNEVAAIAAIYLSEYTPIKPARSLPDQPPAFTIHLIQGVLVLDVSICLPLQYPDDQLPEVTLARRKGLTAAQIDDLYRSLADRMRQEWRGREMCFDIIEHCKEALRFYGERRVSFYDEMVMRREREDRERRNKDVGAVGEFEEKIREELRLREERLIRTNESIPEIHGENRAVIRFDPELLYYEPGEDIPRYIDSVEIVGDYTTKHEADAMHAHPHSGHVQNEPLAKKVRFHEHELVLYQYKLPNDEKTEKRVETLLKRVNDVGLLPHSPYVVRIIGVQYKDGQLLVLAEDTPGRRLSEHMVTVDMDEAPTAFRQLTTGLHHIHQSNYIHKDVRLSTIYYDPTNRLFQIGDIHLHHELNVLFQCEDYPAPMSWLPNELRDKSGGALRKTDVWFLGIVFLQLLFGNEVIDKHSNWSSVRPLIADDQLRSLLDSIFQSAPTYRIIAADILNHPFLIENSPMHVGSTSSSSYGRSTSRFDTDFDQIEVLGKGGFGQVVKARNRVDNRFYAIKKIVLDPENVEYNRRILREVMTLSRLQHERVVRYYQAWIEGGGQSGNGIDREGLTTMHSEHELTSSDSHTPEADLSLSSEDNSSDEVDMRNQSRDWLGDTLSTTPFEEEKSMLQFSVKTGFSVSDLSSPIVDSSSVGGDVRGSTETSDTFKNAPHHDDYQTLYIQMEYCPKRTLRDLIDEGISGSQEIWRLFRQLVEGLSYIHAQGMIHRDLKPSNVFMDHQGNVKIGDFGLATTTSILSSGQGRRSDQEGSINESLTAWIGTPFYTSPEQEQPRARYNSKVDMYALGIIFLEMWCRFGTAMERAECLKRARSVDFALPFIENNVAEGDDEEARRIRILRNLLSHDPKIRLSSAELLASDWIPARTDSDEHTLNSLKSIANPRSQSYQKLVELLFKNTAGDALKDHAYDFNSANVHDVALLERMAVVKETLLLIFRRHGAIDTTIPLFQLQTEDSPEDAIKVIDDGGQLIRLPFDLTRPFARFVARNSMREYRRVAIDRIFRRPVLPGGQPRQPLECDFDVVFEGGDGLAEEAEVVGTAVEAIEATVQCSSSQLTIVLGDVRVVRSIATAFGVDQIAFIDAIASLQHQSAQKRATALHQKFPAINPQRLHKLLTAFTALPVKANVLNDILGRHGQPVIDIVNHLQSLIDQLTGPLSVTIANIAIDPLFVHNPTVYVAGLVFQVLSFTTVPHGARRKRTVEVLAAGGRYDQLIADYGQHHSGDNVKAVGVALSVNKLAIMAEHNDADTMSVVIDNTNVKEALTVAKFLWSHSVSTRLVHDAGVTGRYQITPTRRTGTVLLRDTVRNTETEQGLSHIPQLLSPTSTPHTTQCTPAYQVSFFGALQTRLHASQKSVLSERTIKAIASLHLPSCTVHIHELSRDLLRRVFDNGEVDRSGVDRDTLSRLIGIREKGKEAGEGIVCFYSCKEHVVDIMVIK